MNGTTTSILYCGETYLIQTQDGGPRIHQLETLIYRRGKLVYTRRISYSDLLEDPQREERLVKLVRDQHQAVLEDVASGRLDAPLRKS